MTAEYINFQSVLNNTLGDYIQLGFSLTEPDDHLLELCFKGEPVGWFNQNTATIDNIRDFCQKFIEACDGN